MQYCNHYFDEFPYPNLSNMNQDYEPLFQERFVVLFFNLSRKYNNFYKKNNQENINEIYKYTLDTLSIFKRLIHDNDSFEEYQKKVALRYLNLFYRLIGYTRDKVYGNGEYYISFPLILAFYEVFPKLGLFAIKSFFMSEQSYQYGSWKDAILFCDFIYHFSPNKDNHPLILNIITYINIQLNKDMTEWKFAYNPFNTNFISNVAKWIPRENKKYSWLFHKLAINWVNFKHPYIFRYAKSYNSIRKATNKAKLLYRKQISYLNKQLKTTEISLSNKRMQYHPPNISTFAHNFHSFNKNHFSFQSIIYNKSGIIRHSHIPIHLIIKHALNADPNTHNHYTQNILDMWNSIYNSFSNKFFFLSIPVLDVSLLAQHNSNQAFYTSIAMAIIIASKSYIHNRIIIMGTKPIWITINPSHNIIQIVHYIFNQIDTIQNSYSNLYSTMKFISNTINFSNGSNLFYKKLHFVIFTDFKYHIHFDFNLFFQKNIKQNFSPNIVLWNMSTSSINTDISQLITNKKSYLFSFFTGFSVNALKSLSNLIYKHYKYNTTLTPFQKAESIIQHFNYDLLSDFLYSNFL